MSKCIIYLFVYIFIYLFSGVQMAPVIESVSSTITWSDFLGINVQFNWWNETIVKKQIELIKELNIQWLRVSVHWKLLESTENNFQWSTIDPSFNLIHENNFKTICTFVGTPKWASSNSSSDSDTYPPTNSTKFAERLLFLNNRYPFVNIWEVWNEQNLVPGFWLPTYNPIAYNDLFQATSTLFKSVGFESKLAVGGLGYYGTTSSEANMVMDLLSLNTFENALATYHPYTDQPEGGYGQLADNIYAHLATSRYINSFLKKGKANGIWSGEWGWSTAEDPTEGVDSSTQAEFTIRRLLIDCLVGFNKTFIFTISDLDARASSLRDQGYGLVDINANKKPVYNSLKNLFEITGNTINSIPLSEFGLYLDSSALGDDFVGIFFKKPSTDTTLFAFWSISAKIDFKLLINSTGNLYQVSKNTTEFLKPSTGLLSLSLSPTVQIFEWPIKENESSTSTTTSTTTTSSTSSTSEPSYSIKLVNNFTTTVISILFILLFIK